MSKNKMYVASEIGELKRLLVHSPDGGIGKIVPSKFKDWLYDDTVHLRKMREEYDQYIKLLLYFLDPDKIQEINDWQASHHNRRDIFMPNKDEYFASDAVVEVQVLLEDVLKSEELKTRLVAAICSIEACTLPLEEKLLQLDPRALSKILITGVLREENVDVYIFPPIPNLVFTRDIGIMIKDHILLSKPAKLARRRESVLAKYIFYFNLFKGKEEYVIEITEDDDFFLEDSENQKLRAVTIEGGDIMMISSNHLIVGCSERTSPSAVDKIIHQIFEISSLEIEYITVVKIKEDRAQMHIDTIFTQVSKSAWVMHPKFSERLRLVKDRERKDYSDLLRIGVDRTNHSELEILQFFKHKNATYDSSKNYLYEESAKLNGLEDLLISISVRDFGVKESEVKIIYSGDNQFPYSEREQWTDSCNLLAIKDGVVVGYDRNERTALSFKEKLGYHIVSSSDLIARFDAGEIKPSQVTNTLILLPSTELSRARGGSHCMSMPLLRDRVKV